jgi:HSP20 family protein
MLSRYDPFRELSDMRRAMDRMMESSYFGSEGYQQMLSMPMDVCETEEAFEISATMPGVDPEHIDITMDQNTLTIRGEVRSEEEKEGKTFHLRERRAGVFTRSVTLPSNIDTNSIEANYDNGVLMVRAPKTEETKPKRIQIQSGGSSHMIEGQAQSQEKQKTGRNR